MDDNYYMKLAIAEARKAEFENEVPVGAVLISGNTIIAKAHNLTETLHDVTAHAEMQAITAGTNTLGSKYLNKCTLYVTLEPCIMCAGAIGWSQLGRLVYGASDERRGFSIHAQQALHPKTEVVSGVMSEECLNILKEFFKKKRK